MNWSADKYLSKFICSDAVGSYFNQFEALLNEGKSYFNQIEFFFNEVGSYLNEIRSYLIQVKSNLDLVGLL